MTKLWSQHKYFLLLVFFACGVFLFFVLTSFLKKTEAASPTPTKTPSISSTKRRLKTMEDYLKNISQFKDLTGTTQQLALKNFTDHLNKTVPEDKQCYAEKQGYGCENQIKANYNKTTLLYRLLKYYSVANNKPNTCVKADLGEEKYVKAKGISNPQIFYWLATGSGRVNLDNPKETGRTKSTTVYLCNGADGKRKLRVKDANEKYVKLTPEDLARPELKIENLPPKDNLNTLLTKLNLNQ